MGFVFRPTVTRKLPGGRKVKRRAAFYWVQYLDPSDGLLKRHALKLPTGGRVTDKTVAQEELRKLLKRLERKAAGLLDLAIETAGMPIRTVIARFARHLRGLRRTPKHVRQTIARLVDLSKRGGITRLSDVNEPNVSKALRSLSASGRAPKTLNDIRSCAHALCDWALRVERLLDRNPIESVAKADADDDAGRQWRALTPNEATALLESLAGRFPSPKRQAAADARALMYRVGLFTGLRWGEIAALQWRDLDLDAASPAILLRAKTTKARRSDTVLLRTDLAEALRASRRPFTKPTERVFQTVPKYETFIADCVRASIIMLDEHGRQIPDERGWTVCPHSLRHTFVTWLSASGVAPRTAQMLARHSDIRLTMRTYTDPALLDGRSGVEALPTLAPKQRERERVRATGTDPVVPGVVPIQYNGVQQPAISCNSTHLDDASQGSQDARLSNTVQSNASLKKTGGGGNRTRVPEHFGNGFYVRSRPCGLNRSAVGPAGRRSVQPEKVSRLAVGPRRCASLLISVSPPSRRRRFDGSPYLGGHGIRVVAI